MFPQMGMSSKVAGPQIRESHRLRLNYENAGHI